MFSKCLKYEMKATKRVLVPLIVCMLVVSIATAVCLGGLLSYSYIGDANAGDAMIEIDGSGEASPVEDGAFHLLEVATVLLFMIFVGIMIACVITVFVLMVRRFYTSFFTDEGYLTFTLPVTVDCHLLTKTVSMLIWNFISYLAIAISFGILFLGIYISVPDFFAIDEWTKQYLEKFFEQVGDIFGGAIAFGIIQSIVSTIASCLLLYFSIAVGCMLAKKHKIIACIASYFIISSIVSEIITIVSGIIYDYFAKNIEATVENSNLLAMAVLLIFTLLYVAQSVGCYFGTRWILKNKINLD
jgi:hypothetical protein